MKNFSLIVSRMKGLRRYFVLALVLVGVETAFEVIIPFLMADIIDQGILGNDPQIFFSQGFWMLLCALGSLVTGLMYSRFAAKACSAMAARLRKSQFEKILTFSFGNIDHFDSASLVTRMTSDVMVLQNTLTNGIRPIARGPLMLILGIVMCLAMNAKLSLIFFIVSPFLVLALLFIVSKVAPQYGIIQKTIDTLNAVVEENLTAIRLVKSFVREDYEQKRFDEVNTRLKRLAQKTNYYAFLNTPVFQGSMYAVIMLLLFIGSQMIVQGSLEVGQLTGILSYVLQIMNSFMMMSNVFLLLTRSFASLGRIEEVFAQRPSLENPPAPLKMEDGSIRFEDVTFRYASAAENPVLENITLDIPSGSRIGVIGGTGSAKTSLVQLIARLYDVEKGSVKVGGQDVRNLNMEELRSSIGMVLQQSVLFSGTIEENLRWGDPDATQEEIDAACHAACADEFIARLPGRLQMELGQGGVNVSGGQKQRLSIARALLKKPKILILDDSTSAVDTRTDAKIRKALAEMKGMTQIIIASRVSSIAHCDQIVVMENGRIEQVGTHEQLLETSPIYREIVESQKGGLQDE